MPGAIGTGRSLKAEELAACHLVALIREYALSRAMGDAIESLHDTYQIGQEGGDRQETGENCGAAGA